jgi:YegS/Rv2252/BmrU family lipid kinase
VIETPRRHWTALTSALVCATLLAVLAVLVTNHWSPLQEADTDVGRQPELFTFTHDWARSTFVWIGRIFDTWPMTAYTILTVVALALKGHRRAAVWTASVMASVLIANPLLKLLVARDRPVWDDPVQTLKSFSFPSGHSAGIAAAAGVTIVLSLMLVRRRALRRATIVVAIALALLVGADRIFLGVHNLSDVVGGYLLGATLVLLGLFVGDPEPRSIALANAPLPDAIPHAERRLAAILNPVKVDDPAGFRVMVENMAADSGWRDVTWWETTVEDTGYRMAHEAAVSGADVVLAIGGDGTIRAVCEELAGTGIPVGIVPAGTGNLLARNLSIPLYLRAAVDVAMHGQDRAIDMVRVSGDEMDDATFLVMAGMGFDAAIMEGVNEGFKAKVGWLAYVWSALKALMFPAIRVEVSVDGGEFTRHRARTIVIGNVGSLQAGMPLIPDAAIDDGQLDVVLLYPRRFLSWIPIAARVLTKDKRTDETITRMTGHEVVVRTPAPAPRQLDGDLIAPGKELRAECVHGRLLVRVPR